MRAESGMGGFGGERCFGMGKEEGKKGAKGGVGVGGKSSGLLRVCARKPDIFQILLCEMRS